MIDRYFAFSCGLHTLVLLIVLLVTSPAAKKPSATYTIDFIGSGKVIATTGQEAASKTAVQTPQPTEQKAPETKPAEKAPAKKAYAAKTEIAAKPKPKKKAAPLAAPTVLEDEAKEAQEAAKKAEADAAENGFGGGNIQTDFADFPYPWYITQVRNSLWIEWEKRRPAGTTLSALVTFAIARDGKIKDLEVERKSGDDTFDFSASSAVINAGPFAPLPMYYEKDELTVTVEFKQEK